MSDNVLKKYIKSIIEEKHIKIQNGIIEKIINEVIFDGENNEFNVSKHNNIVEVELPDSSKRRVIFSDDIVLDRYLIVILEEIGKNFKDVILYSINNETGDIEFINSIH